MKSARFDNKESAKLFAKKHNGYYEFTVDEKMNAIYIVFYK